MKKGWVVAGIIVGMVALVLIGLLITGGLLAAARGGIGPHVTVGRYVHPWGMDLDRGGRMIMAGGGLLVLLLFAVMLGGSVLAAVWYASRKQKPTEVSRSEPTPLDILKKRYASGEIDREEYERMREELT